MARNVCDLVDVPRMAERELRVLNADQVRQMFAAAQGERMEAIFILP